ncbi:MAG: MarR family winged helix-turn-helix transcriptional regulator [Pseudomonadota bacterium]|nr:MarR family winged helix-turn-helix transcriptional regulator [Pseudomonadota bacterium]
MAKVKTKLAGDGLGGSATHLLHRALQLALDFHTEAAGPATITQRQFTVLAAAGAADGGTQNDLVRATGIDRSTLADLVARMLAKGLLERERSATDARANTVRLSAAGRAALDAGTGPSAAADARLLSLLAPKKRDTFLKILTALAAAADHPGEAKAKPANDKSVKPDKKKKKKAKKAKDVGA